MFNQSVKQKLMMGFRQSRPFVIWLDSFAEGWVPKKSWALRKLRYVTRNCCPNMIFGQNARCRKNNMKFCCHSWENQPCGTAISHVRLYYIQKIESTQNAMSLTGQRSCPSSSLRNLMVLTSSGQTLWTFCCSGSFDCKIESLLVKNHNNITNETVTRLVTRCLYILYRLESDISDWFQQPLCYSRPIISKKDSVCFFVWLLRLVSSCFLHPVNTNEYIYIYIIYKSVMTHVNRIWHDVSGKTRKHYQKQIRQEWKTQPNDQIAP